MNDVLEKKLITAGATLVGFADIASALDSYIAHLGRAISIGIDRNLSEDTVNCLGELQKVASLFLKEKGYRYLCVPPDSDRISGTFVSRLYPLLTHKAAATSAGLGWIGRNGLLINARYGPRLSLATVLTDAPLAPSVPVEFSMCGDCRLCVDFCPSDAISGQDWSRFDPFVELVRLEHCRSHKENARAVDGRPNCGLCLKICPLGRKKQSEVRAVLVRK